MGYIAEFIKSLADRSQLVAHQLLWNMKTNMFKDEDSLVKDGILIYNVNVCNINIRYLLLSQNCMILLKPS